LVQLFIIVTLNTTATVTFGTDTFYGKNDLNYQHKSPAIVGAVVAFCPVVVVVGVAGVEVFGYRLKSIIRKFIATVGYGLYC
jgi:hypothetical protein